MQCVRGWCVGFACLTAALTCLGGSFDKSQFNGRWDISVSGAEPRGRAWWLEVTGAGTDAVKGKFVGAPGGQLDDIPKITIYDGELRFSLEGIYHRERVGPKRPDAPREHRRDPRPMETGLYWARLEAGKLKGTFEIEGDPFSYLEWTGVRAPVLPDKDDGTWKRGDAVTLFNGRDVTGWQPLLTTRPAGWSVTKDGVLTNSPGAVDLVSEKKFQNFDLHVEYLIGPRSNSGIGLRGRYEVQILDDFGRMPTLHGNGALYSRIAPVVNASKPPGEWQVFDIRLIGRQVSVTLNGFKVIDKGTIEGLTAIASDPNEGEPGPISLQGDHGLVQFRKIVVYPLLRTR
ncbi:MAG: DUF1080 domain-containing protein [Acidobacteriota bacterium]|nr:DUF1080 domain-containing protein [Acidobacteriota bacterium]